MTKDSFVACMETVTAFCWGPLSFLCAYYISTAHSLRYPMQSIVSLGQLYGLILYYGTCAFEEYIHGIVLSRPERVYYWAYYVLCNAFWLFIPGWLIFQSTRETSAAFAKVSRMKNNQTVKPESTP
jgi:cholestenol delta-isomerase